MSLFDDLKKATLAKIANVMGTDEQTHSSVEDLIESIKSQLGEWQDTNVRIAITGQSGSGKSSLLNAIAGKKIAGVGITETTVDAQEYDGDNGLTLVDLPGCGTKKFPFEKTDTHDAYVDRMKLNSFDAIILVTANRFFEGDISLYNYVLHQMKKPIFLVRTQMDKAVEDAMEDNGIDRDQVITTVLDDIAENIDCEDPKKIYLVSSRKNHIANFDTDRLIHDISESLAPVKKSKFLVESKAYSESAIKERRVIFEQLIQRYAYLSAANGFNPIPGLNVAVDVDLLLKMSENILRSYGLSTDDDQEPKLIGAASGTGKWAAQFLTATGIKQLLVRYGAAETTKVVASWVPLVGQTIAAGIGYQLTTRYGMNLLDDAEKRAIQKLEEFQNKLLDA